MGIKAFNHGDDFVNKFVRAVVSDSTGADAVNPPPPPVQQGLQASGGIISDYTDPGTSKVYRTHIYTSSGTFVVTDDGNYGNNIDFLVVAGGGGGGKLKASGNGGRGGGGAGGLRSNIPTVPYNIPDSSLAYPGSGTYTYTVTVGAGGAKREAPAPGSPQTTGFNGGNSSVTGPAHPGSGGAGGVVASGGGGGTTLPGVDAADGGSGGGGAYGASAADTVAATDGISPTVQGYNGGGGSGSGGGGGGAGGVGAKDGGDGLVVAIAEPPATPAPTRQYGANGGYFAGGGGGGGGYSSSTGGDFGKGGGGYGSDHPSNPGNPATDGTEATGGGGGGGSATPGNDGPSFGAANGGSGIVVLRYQIAEIAADAKASGGVVSFYNDKTIHTFTSAGSFSTPGSFNENVEYFMVGGGASGGNYAGGGGGAGGIKSGTTPINGAVTYPVVIGAGGAEVHSNTDNGGEGRTGGTTSWGPIDVGGGGGGGSHSPPRAGVNGPSGGSGGGAGSDGGGSWTGGSSPGSTHPGSYPFPAATGSPVHGWGSDGGDAPSYPGTGGGGGAGQDGSGPPAKGGYGAQVPVTFMDPASGAGDPAPGAPAAGGKWFAGGGDGWRNVSPVPQTRPFGGGGYFTPNPSPPRGIPGLVNTGGGGAGGNGNSYPSGAGGSGIVMVAYPS